MIKYYRYSIDYHDQIIQFLKKEWISINTEKWSDYFRWKFMNNPLIENPPVFIAVEDDKVVGFRGLFVQKYVYNNNIFLIAQSSDSKVAASHRKRGIFRSLIDMTFEYCKENNIKFNLTLSSNENSTPIYMKLGWYPLRTKREMIKLSINTFLKKRRINNSDKNVYEYGGYSINEYNINNILDDKVIKELAKSAVHFENINKIHSVRDYNYYKYKLANPVSKYLVYTFYKNEELKGHLIVKKLNTLKYILKVSPLKIIDYHLHTNEEDKMLKVFLRKICLNSYLLRNSIVSVPLLTMDKKYERLFFNRGFLKESKYSDKLTGRRSIPFLIRPININADEWYIDDISVKKYSNWQLTGIDVDNA